MDIKWLKFHIKVFINQVYNNNKSRKIPRLRSSKETILFIYINTITIFILNKQKYSIDIKKYHELSFCTENHLDCFCYQDTFDYYGTRCPSLKEYSVKETTKRAYTIAAYFENGHFIWRSVAFTQYPIRDKIQSESSALFQRRGTAVYLCTNKSVKIPIAPKILMKKIYWLIYREKQAMKD